MSLLEDVFLQDEANEAQELERVIEGDEYDERPRSRSDSDENSEQENEAEEDKRRVDPASTKTRRVIKNPRFVLNPARLTGPRGIHVIPEHFKDFKFKGKGHEREDLDLVLKKLEHWAYRLYPKFQFEDCLKKIETLGKKRAVMVNLQKIRSDQFISDEPIVQKDSSEDETPQDEFDKLLQQQIDLARATDSKTDKLDSPVRDNVSFILPKATSSPSINDEQKERMMRNRKLAEERRLARLKNAANSGNTEHIPGLHEGSNENMTNDFNKEDIKKSRINRSNIIDSDDDVEVRNESITVDVHNNSDINTNEDLKINNKDNIENINNDRENDIHIDNNDKSTNECNDNHENNDKINDINETSNKISDGNSTEAVKDINEVISQEVTEKISSELNEELMDVDFDDF